MHLRRGLFLALLHILLAALLITALERRQRSWFERDEDAHRQAWAEDPASAGAAPEEAGSTVSFDPCLMWRHRPSQEVLLTGVNLPAILLAGWGEDCPARWTLAGRMVQRDWWIPHNTLLERQRRLDRETIALAGLLWFLVGAFPLIQPYRKWLEPGILITLCAIPGTILALIPAVEGLANVPGLAAHCIWLAEAILLVSLPFRLAWNRWHYGRWR